jgi:hypothetical protein
MSNFGLMSCKSTITNNQMLLHLKFEPGDFSGNTLANWATGAPVYEVNLSGTTLPTLNSTDQKVGSGSCNIASNTTFSMITFPFSFNDYMTPSKKAMSVALWFKNTKNADNSQTYQHMICLGSASAYIRFINGNLVLGGSSGEYSAGTTYYTDGFWHHVVLMFNTLGQITVFIDGVKKVTNKTSAYFKSTDTNIWLGQFTNSPSAGTNAFAFTGNLDDVRIYSRMLTDAEVTTIYTNTNDITSNLLIYYKCKLGDINGAVITNYGSLNGTQTTILDTNTNPVYSIQSSTINGKTLSKMNYCLDLSNSAHYIKAPPLSITGGTSMTVASWIYFRTNTKNYARILTFSVDSYLCFSDDRYNNKIIMISYIGSSNQYFTTVELVYENWYHIVFVFDVANNKITLYINNVAQVLTNNNTTVCGSISNTNNNTLIGSDTQNFLGNYAFTDYRIYNRALNTSEVNTLYNYVQT